MFNLGAFLSYVLAMIFSPGPNNIVSMASATKFGFKKTLKFIMGVFTGFFIVMILCSFFNFLLFKLIPKVNGFIGLLGASYMVYLAIKIIKGKKKSNSINEQLDNEEYSSEDSIGFNSFFSGMTMQFVNPKTIIFSITVVSNFIIPHFNSSISLLLFSILLATIASLSTSVWALFGSIFNQFLSKYEKQFNLFMGLLLVYSALMISGITQLFY